MITVVRPGPLTTVQDLGRPGYAHLGVPRSGALDQAALRRANALVGNGIEAAGLETTLLGASADEATAGLEEVVDEKWQGENSWKTFTAALAIGTADLQKNAESFQAADNPNYQLINIAAARKLGILPLAFQSDDEFIAAPQADEESDEE